MYLNLIIPQVEDANSLETEIGGITEVLVFDLVKG